jgi:hypothetical protein
MTIFYLALTCGKEASATNLKDAIDTAQANNRNIKLEQIRLNSVKTEKTKAIAEFLPNVIANPPMDKETVIIRGKLMIVQPSRRLRK